MSRQSEFAAALLDPRQACPPGLISANGADSESRFAVYRNNVLSSLINALADNYPVVTQLVGEEFFRGMAGVYVQSAAPRSPIMSDYGADFSGFIERFEPAAGVPYLADVARLERLQIEAGHAADAQPMSAEQVVELLSCPTLAAHLKIAFHPSLRLLKSPFAVVTIWAAHQQKPLVAFEPRAAQNALVLRNGLDVEVLAISHGAHAFITSLQQGLPLTAAIERYTDLDLEHLLGRLIRHQAITGLLSEQVTQ
ncbi:Putative DNA-binding domain-containing protein [Pseudomonas sp. 43mfcvi1.1]|uniref:HvfC/BufC N-terminal domain-containing protein n=1 Tax=Pseudomonas sp. 43mfcvi1.1 TaxID=1761894 RepID=UPI000D6A9491|nr:DNA-binding domain-containing protein [Pseudomonas sp. 43mfcvi1.1]PWJ31042.1 putative DNA-binding protein [Pseudomonas sp. 43mfcvi1.1]SSB99002.1 Putative DNA-binding domain-containing protein [Pseudomonas sp. 43mfcvi1.1]